MDEVVCLCFHRHDQFANWRRLVSHHYSGPNLGFPHGDARLDLTDLYIFPKPDDPQKSVFIMDVHPSASLSPPGATMPEPYSHEAVYEIKVEEAPVSIGKEVHVTGAWIQAERGARPSQSVFPTGSEKPAYFASEPADDDRSVPVHAHSLEHTGGYSWEEAMRVARALLPDVLVHEPSRRAHSPENGRALLDDVMDGFISTLTNAKVTTDGVSAHADLLDAFPFLGPPHEIRTFSVARA
jgi:hypothetical protein